MYIQLAYNKPCKHVNFSLERTASEIWISWGWSKAVAMASFRDKELTCRTSAASISGVHWLAMWEAWLTSRQAHLWGRENHSESLHLVQENRNTSLLYFTKIANLFNTYVYWYASNFIGSLIFRGLEGEGGLSYWTCAYSELQSVRSKNVQLNFQ